MCFSAEASFIVGGTLLIIGVATIRKTHHKQDIIIALIPLIFATQQIIEGFLWISLINNSMLHAQFWLSNIYGVIIGVIWPFYAPFAVYKAETNARRKKILGSIVVVGLGLSAYTILGLINQPIVTQIINYSISYKHEVAGYQFVIVMYLLATCVPFIFSSYRHLSIAGIVLTIGFFVAFLTYTETFASVWCFFAAITSSLIYLYITRRINNPLIPVPSGIS
ncbi:MAG: hypothetical protein Q8K59_07825 [Nitrosomonas sp.]|nr:hypothetical protein [Nitrosomonas sp.]MDP1950986.1 hypothetical protein [Nitrosomonas sp.]